MPTPEITRAPARGGAPGHRARASRCSRVLDDVARPPARRPGDRARPRGRRARSPPRPPTTSARRCTAPGSPAASSRRAAPARYEPRVGDNHHHLVCRACGAVARRRLRRRRGALPGSRRTRAGFVVDEAEVIFWGAAAPTASSAPAATEEEQRMTDVASQGRPPARPTATLTNRQGHPVYDNQNQRTVGARGPATLENYQFLEKISHFDRERIPERVVHARGATAFGYFEADGTVGDEPIAKYTRAKLFQEAGKRTDVAAALLHRRRRPRLLRGRPRPARLRGEVLHRGRQLGPRRQQPRRLLHPRRDQVPRLHPLAEARPGHVRAPGRQPGLRLHVARRPRRMHMVTLVLQPARHPGELPAHAGLRREHLQVGQRRRARPSWSSTTGCPSRA